MKCVLSKRAHSFRLRIYALRDVSGLLLQQRLGSEGSKIFNWPFESITCQPILQANP